MDTNQNRVSIPSDDIITNMNRFNMVIGNSIKSCGYEENGENKYIKRPVIGLPVDKYVVLDIDTQSGVERFNTELAQNTLRRSIFAYVPTDKGILLVCDAKTAGSVDYDSDARYERISQKRKYYDMHCLSKVTMKKRTMIVLLWATEEQKMLVNTWNTLADYAEKMGPWITVVSMVDSVVIPKIQKLSFEVDI